jgi:hypothetical protein
MAADGSPIHVETLTMENMMDELDWWGEEVASWLVE